MINDPVANQPLLDYTTLPPQIKLILDPDKRRLVSNIYQNYHLFKDFRDSFGNTVLHYAYSSNNLDAVILLTAIFNFTPSKNNEGKLPIALFDVEEATKKGKIRDLLSISSLNNEIYKKLINTLLLLENDDVKVVLFMKFIRQNLILNMEICPDQFNYNFSKLLENDSDGKFKTCLLNLFTKFSNPDLDVFYQKISGFNNPDIVNLFSLKILEIILNRDNDKDKKDSLGFILRIGIKTNLDFIYEYIIANPSNYNGFLHDEGYQGDEDDESYKGDKQNKNLAELLIDSHLSYEQKSSLVKTILTDENFDESTKNKFFSATLNHQKFLESFIDEDSVQKLLLAWNFDNLDEDNLFLAFKQISSIQEEKENEYNKLLLSKILKSILTSTNIAFDTRIYCLSSMLYKSKKIPLDLIHEYFMNNKLNSIEGLMDKDIIGKFGKLIVNSEFNYEKKSSLIKKFFSEKNSDDESFDVEVKKNIFISLFKNEEFASQFLIKNFYYFAIYARYLPREYQQKISIIRTAIDKETQTQIDLQNSTRGTQIKEVRELEDKRTQTQISTRNKGSQTAEDLREFGPIEASIKEDDGSKILAEAEAEIVQAKPLSASPSKPMKMKQASFKESSFEDYEYLSKLLSGAVSDGIKKVQSYNPDLETITAELKQFNVNFTQHNPFGNEGLTADQDLAGLFHSWFNPLLNKISNSDFREDKDKLKTYLYAILCISAGEPESIIKFYNYYDYFINNNTDADVRFGTGHGSWISTPEQYSKLKVIIRKLDELVKINPDIFTKENLNAYLKCQFQDRRIKNFRFRENEEFISNLIKSLDVKPSDPKAEELEGTRTDLKDFLKPNAIFLENLVKIVNQDGHENKGLADYLFEHLIAKITPSPTEVDQHTGLANADKLEKIEELKKDFNKKINEFINKINSSIKPDFLDDPHHQLIFELILEIPIDLQDFLKSKLNQDLADNKGVEIRASAVSRKISNFIKSLESQDPDDQRKSIVEFREICLEQSQIYSQKARELRELISPAKTSSASASR